MTKVKLHPEGETPSATPGVQANGIVYVTDSKDRKIGLKEPPFLAEFDIIDVVGPEKSKNETFMNMLNPLLYIVEIDGGKVEFPKTMIQVRALIQLADRHGFMAAVKGITEHFAQNDAALNEQIKNVVGTSG